MSRVSAVLKTLLYHKIQVICKISDIRQRQYTEHAVVHSKIICSLQNLKTQLHQSRPDLKSLLHLQYLGTH